MSTNRKKKTTASFIRSEMTPAGPPANTRRNAATKRLESIRLREYQDGNMTSVEMVEWFLQDVEQATRADISGATGLAWATVHNALEAIDHEHHLTRHLHCDPEEYAWKH